MGYVRNMVLSKIICNLLQDGYIHIYMYIYIYIDIDRYKIYGPYRRAMRLYTKSFDRGSGTRPNLPG